MDRLQQFTVSFLDGDMYKCPYGYRSIELICCQVSPQTSNENKEMKQLNILS